MLKQPMIEKLAAMRLLGMVEALKTQEQDPAARELSFSERFGLLVDQQWNWRESQALTRGLKSAKLRHNACIEDIDCRATRGWRRWSFADTRRSTLGLPRCFAISRSLAPMAVCAVC